jgi:tryptophan synthase beta chain
MMLPININPQEYRPMSKNKPIGKEHAVFLPQDEMPTHWYNIQADLPEPLPPLLHPGTKEPLRPGLNPRIWAEELVRQEDTKERYVSIPDEVIDAYLSMPRPTPLFRARRLEAYLKTPARIYFKCEYTNAAGSHKPNTAIPQAYYCMAQGTERVATETGAGQWGSALAMASAFFDLRCRVFMVRVSYDQKPGRRTMMETWGAEVFPSPSTQTKFGRSLLEEDSNHPGTLGIAISEAIEDTLANENTRYCLGSVLNHVLMHQTIVGQEAKKQFEMIDTYPDVVIGCIGGGSNYAGFSFPFMMDKLQGKRDVEFIACESKSVPHTTRGVYTYDFGDTAETTPLAKMLTLGHKYACPPIHAGGLRYHGMAPLISYLIQKGFMRSVAYQQTEVFEAARILARTEGFIIAPETAHAVKCAIDEAVACKKTGEAKVIAFNNSGHGLLDLSAYETFLAGKLTDFEPVRIEVPKYVT